MMFNLKNNFNNTKGISLVALVITIIVILILIGISISSAIKSDLIGIAQKVKNDELIAQEEEKLNMAVVSAYLKGNMKIKLNDLNEELSNTFNKNITLSGNETWIYIGEFGQTYIINKDGTISKIEEVQNGLYSDNEGKRYIINEDGTILKLEELQKRLYSDNEGKKYIINEDGTILKLEELQKGLYSDSEGKRYTINSNGEIQETDCFTVQELLDNGYYISKNAGDKLECNGRYTIRNDNIPCIAIRFKILGSDKEWYSGYALISGKEIDVSKYNNSSYGDINTFGDDHLYQMIYAWWRDHKVYINNIELTNTIYLEDTIDGKKEVREESIELYNKLVESAKLLLLD